MAVSKKIREFVGEIAIPAGVGMLEYRVLIYQLLLLPRLLRIDVKPGAIQYAYASEAPVDDMDVPAKLSDGSPYMSLRNKNIESSPSTGLLDLLDHIAQAGLWPVGFVLSADTLLWTYLENSHAFKASSRTVLLGHPVFIDDMVPPDTVLVPVAESPVFPVEDAAMSYKFQFSTIEVVP